MRVLIPSPPHYASRLQAAFHKVAPDVETIVCPMIESVPLPANLTDILTSLDSFHYVVLPSRMAIDALASVWDARPHSCGLLVMGKDADHLTDVLDASPALIPTEPSPAGIVKALSLQPHIADQRIAVLSPRFTGLDEPSTIPDMLADLTNLGLQVTRIDAYETHPTSTSTRAEAYHAIAHSHVDVLAFTSAGEVFSFVSGYHDNVHDLLSHTRVACFGPYTAQRAASAGVTVDYVPPAFASFSDYVAGLVAYYR